MPARGGAEERIRTKLLEDGHIDKIVETYQFRKEEDRYSKCIGMERIAEETWQAGYDVAADSKE